jgi:hypothetical protein
MDGIDRQRGVHMKRMLIAAALLATVVAAPASAVPGSPAGLDQAASAIDNVEKVYGGHRSCEWGPVRGWHRHVGWAAVPVPCVPLAARPFRCWVDYWGVRRCRW